MTVYVIAEINIHDRDRYQQYEAGFMDVFQQFEGTMLSVDENPEVMEGQWDATRSVLISFPSSEAARDWSDSDAYQAIATHRHAASVARIIIARGLDELMA